MSQRISQPRQNSSSRTGTSATEVATRNTMNMTFRLRAGAMELAGAPVMKLSNSQ